MTEWKCSANPRAVVPSDCNWPHCGCDPNVERVITGLQECGYAIIEPNDVSDGPEEIAGLIERAEAQAMSRWGGPNNEHKNSLEWSLAAALKGLAREVERLKGDLNQPEAGATERMMAENTEFWKGWIHAIRNVDIALACRGDDRVIRRCRQEVLRLACVSCEPDHIVFLPVWPSDERLIELLSGPTGIPAALSAQETEEGK